MEDLACGVFVEDAVPGEIFQSGIRVAKVIERPSCRNLLRLEGRMEVVIEIAVVRRDPREAPAHPFTNGLYLRDRRTGNSHIRDIVVSKVLKDAIDVIDLEKASNALFRLAGSHHEMLNEKLTLAVEEICQRFLPIRCVEDILLLHLPPGQLAPAAGSVHRAAASSPSLS